jgi:tetratricopeptide (TPR) repeat protein
MLIPAESRCAVIVTSRMPLTSLDAEHVAVPPVPPAAAVQVIRELVGAERTDQDAPAVADLARSCSYLPLALRIAAGRLIDRPDWTVADLARRIGDRTATPREFTVGDDRLRASFAVTWRELATGDERAAELFLLFGVVSLVDLGPDLAGAVLDVDPERARAILDRLVDLHLLEPAAGRYRPHDLLRLFATEIAAAQGLRPTPRLTAILRWFDAGARQASALAGRPVGYRATSPDPRSPQPTVTDNQAAGRWLDDERANFVATVGQALETGDDLADLAADLAIALYPSLLMRCHGPEFELICRAVLETPPGRVNRRSAVRVATGLGMLYRMQGRHDEALHHLDQALAVARYVGDQVAQGKALEVVAQVHVSRGQPTAAIPIFEESLRLRRASGDLVGEGTVLSNAAEAYLRTGRADVALDMLNRSLEIRRHCGDLVGEAITQENIAEVHLAEGRAEDAHRHAQAAIASARGCDARDVERRALTLSARIELRLGRHAAALATCQAALAMASTASPTNSSDLRELAVAFRAAGDPASADLIEAGLSS